MSESKANQCEFHLIKAWMPVSKPYLKASIASITDVSLQTPLYDIHSITQTSSDRYLISAGTGITHAIHDVCLSSGICTKAADVSGVIKAVVHDDAILAIRAYQPMAIVKYGMVVSMTDVKVRTRTSSSREVVATERLLQMRGSDVYVIDANSCLYLIKWRDLLDGIPVAKKLIAYGVEDFYATSRSIGNCMTIIVYRFLGGQRYSSMRDLRVLSGPSY